MLLFTFVIQKTGISVTGEEIRENKMHPASEFVRDQKEKMWLKNNSGNDIETCVNLPLH